LQYKLFTLSNPERVVIDLAGARLSAPVKGIDYSGSMLKAVRSGARNNQDLRIVLDTNVLTRPESFVLQPNEKYGYRLVVDLYDPAARTSAVIKAENTPPVPTVTAEPAVRDVIIAIDAGHGGEDPGAQGYNGTHEKEVVLAIARRLKTLIENEKGMRPVMIRDGDYYVGLRKRIQKAREYKADLFVSIHADAFRNRHARGSSVYVVSEHGASSEAALWLAESENASDLVGGVSLDGKDELLASVLLDLSQEATMASSHDVATRVLGELKTIGSIHRPQVERAGFVVLKAPDIPSLLVETGFISNPAEEKKLRNPQHQEAIAQAVMKGIHAYFNAAAPAGTKFAAREHVIARGETLSSVAENYRVSVETLRTANKLENNEVREGMVLRIPPRGDT
jgi:N-acetylmuramoyl-L-alanine amidase